LWIFRERTGRIKASLAPLAAHAALTRPGALPGMAIAGATRSVSRYGFLVTVAYTELMRIWLDLPDDFVEQLAEKGQDLSKAALEALAINAYRMNRISGYQLGQLLEIPSRYELDGFLKHHGVPLEYTIEDFERESATSARLWQERQEELAAERDRRPE
jgi:predicted HTH domain antitoxin